MKQNPLKNVGEIHKEWTAAATLDAAFWTICSLFIKRAEQPPNKALQ